ncbi:unnamed protein product, partial [Hymenolepis diminuta]
IILVEFAKFLEHVLKSINIQLKNDQVNYYSCAESTSLTVPHFILTNFSDGIPDDMRTEMLEEQSDLLDRSNECTITDRTEFNTQMFFDNNCCYSSNTPGFSLSSQYDPIQPCFRSLLSASEEAETLDANGNCEFPFSSESAISLPLGYQFSTHPISAEISNPAIQDNKVVEPLPHEQTLLESVSADNNYSSEADLAVAAISGEMSNSPNPACNNIYDFHSCGPYYNSNYSPLCNPFDPILY